jgi:hypothetical protein
MTELFLCVMFNRGNQHAEQGSLAWTALQVDGPLSPFNDAVHHASPIPCLRRDFFVVKKGIKNPIPD